MRKCARITVILAGFALLCGTTARAELPASALYQSCDKRGQSDLCVGYIMGVVAGLEYGKLSGNYCIPPNIAYAEALLTFRKFVEGHPSVLSSPLGQDSAGVIAMAIVQAFPCKR